MFTYNVYEYKGTGEYIHEKEQHPVAVCKTPELAQRFLDELCKNAKEIDGVFPEWQDSSLTGDRRLIIFYDDIARSFKLYGVERETVFTTPQEVRGHAEIIAEHL